MLEEMKSIVLEEHDFENRDESMLKTFLAFLDIKIPIPQRNW